MPSSLSDFQSVPAETGWETGADRFHGDGRPATDAAFAHHLPPFLTQEDSGIRNTGQRSRLTSICDGIARGEGH